jgi:hypothetical protein
MIRLSPYLLEHLQSTTKQSTYLLNAHTCNLAPVNALSPSPQVKGAQGGLSLVHQKHE